jgi:uncharacterized membrane protein YccF (DUF307 family)
MSQQHNTPVLIDRGQPGCLVSVLWFIFIGSWLSFFWILIAWGLIVLIITMPIGLAMMHRVPLIASLRQPSREYIVATQGTATVIQEVNRPQQLFLIRAIYFLLIGWWFSLIWVLVAWFATATIILMPLGIWMMNRIPAVTTLERY